MFVEGRIKVPQRYPHPTPWNLWICYVTWQRRIKVAHQLTKKEKKEIILNYPVGLSVIPRGLNVEKVGRRVHHSDVVRELDLFLLALKEEGSTSQGMQAASRSWKRQENGSYWSWLGRMKSYWWLWFLYCETVRFMTYETIR